jgi:hypothetical protein
MCTLELPRSDDFIPGNTNPAIWRGFLYFTYPDNLTPKNNFNQFNFPMLVKDGNYGYRTGYINMINNRTAYVWAGPNERGFSLQPRRVDEAGVGWDTTIYITYELAYRPFLL